MIFKQPLNGAAEQLFDYSQTVPVIDTHEHVPVSEKEYNEQTIKFGTLFNPYISNDLRSAGMRFPEGVAPAFHCIEDDWKAFEPHWNSVKHGSYARPLRIALQRFYGVDDFTEANYLEIVAQINENNKPGIYKRVFVDECRIEKAIVCANALPAPSDPILVGNITSPSALVMSRETLVKMAADVGVAEITSLDDVVAVSDRWMELQASKGAIEFKSAAAPMEAPDRAKAGQALARLLAGDEVSKEDMLALAVYVREANARKAAELNVPIALHTGVWNDYRAVDVTDLIGFVQRNPGTRMDIYHLGIPRVRDAIQIVKNFPNAFLNLCWAHIVASDMVVNTMKEAVDMVPLNKIFAFGADYILFVEKVYGHLQMARENVALVLGDRVDRNLMSLDEARQTLRAWFYDNPKAFYGL